MIKPFCDLCEKSLAEAKKMISISEIVFYELPNRPRGQSGLHFCDAGCAHGWIVKTANRPLLVQPTSN